MKLSSKVLSKLFYNNYPFFHITPTVNIPGILEKGLEIRNGQGVCTVVVNDETVNTHIIYTQLQNTGAIDFSVIRLTPQKHQLLFKQLMLDGSPMITNPLHLYIVKDKIFIEQEDIISQIIFDPAVNDDENAILIRVEELFNELNTTLT